MRTLALSLLTLLTAACDSGGPEAELDIRLFDTQEIEVGTGVLMLDTSLGLGVRTGGRYTLVVSGLDWTGPLEATCDDTGALTIALDPGTIDGGRDLSGRCGARLEGGDTFTNSVGGPQRTGRFEFVDRLVYYDGPDPQDR